MNKMLTGNIDKKIIFRNFGVMEDYLIYNTIGDRRYPDSFKENYHCHILCRSGEMRFEAMENPFTAGPGDLVIWQMTTRISNVIYSDDFDADFLLISNPFHENCKEQREVSWYAGELCITPKYLSAICQKITGKSALYWIEYYTVHEILLLLNNPSLTLTEVTDMMHFPAPPMLTRYLKRTIGKTPSEYRSGQV